MLPLPLPHPVEAALGNGRTRAASYQTARAATARSTRCTSARRSATNRLVRPTTPRSQTRPALLPAKITLGFARGAPASSPDTPAPAPAADTVATRAHKRWPASAFPALHAAAPRCTPGESDPTPAAAPAGPPPAASPLPASACDACARAARSAPDVRPRSAPAQSPA